MENTNNDEKIVNIEEENLDNVNEGIKEIEKEIQNKKHIPKERQNKMNKKVFENMVIAIVVMAFLYCISLGSLNIESTVFITDLKVFSMGIIVLTIILFEISYRKENGSLAVHGIEGLVLSIFMLFSNYMYTMYIKDFYAYVSIFAYAFAIYLVAKSIVIYKKMKKEYVASLSDIEEITKKH
jgi:O-antigen/teichoic acid export membrane protein